MNDAEKMILVVRRSRHGADKLKELIEFMDTMPVSVASPENWQATIAERRLAALFVGEDLEKDEIDQLVDAVGDLNPDIPIVILSNGAGR